MHMSYQMPSSRSRAANLVKYIFWSFSLTVRFYLLNCEAKDNDSKTSLLWNMALPLTSDLRVEWTKEQGFVWHCTTVLHHTVPTWSLQTIQEFLAIHRIIRTFYIFLELKTFLGGQRFVTNKEGLQYIGSQNVLDRVGGIVTIWHMLQLFWRFSRKNESTQLLIWRLEQH